METMKYIIVITALARSKLRIPSVRSTVDKKLEERDMHARSIAQAKKRVTGVAKNREKEIPSGVLISRMLVFSLRKLLPFVPVCFYLSSPIRHFFLPAGFA